MVIINTDFFSIKKDDFECDIINILHSYYKLKTLIQDSSTHLKISISC